MLRVCYVCVCVYVREYVCPWYVSVVRVCMCVRGMCALRGAHASVAAVACAMDKTDLII